MNGIATRAASAAAKLALSTLVVLGSACGGDESLVDGIFSDAEWAVVTTLSPLPEVPGSPSNAVADDARAATLGQRFFFESSHAGAIVVADDGSNGGLGSAGETGKVSCASCHMAAVWFDDERSNPSATSLGVDWGGRHTPPVVNATFYRWFKWGGGAESMWHQALGTTESSKSHGSSRLAVAHMIYATYRSEYEAIFGNMPGLADTAAFPATGKPGDASFDGMSSVDQDAINQVFANFGKCIEAYQRLLVSRDAPFDQYVAGDTEAISAAAKSGLKLFVGKAGCIECHKTPLLSDSNFDNLGIAQEGTHVASADTGRFDAVAKLLASPFNSEGDYSDGSTGLLADLVQTEEMRGQFRVKHLRQVAETAPYMHTGQFASLRAVVEFYNDGGGDSGFDGAKSSLMVPLNLTSAEIDELVAFLSTLTGEPVPVALMEDTSAP